MRALNYLKNRFENAILDKRPLKIGASDVKALNELIQFFNGKDVDNNIEDSLLLFYILKHWKVQNESNSLSFHLTLPYTISTADSILEKLFILLDPKEKVVEMIATELAVHQLMNGVRREETIRKSDVRKLLDEAINRVKSGKTAINKLNEIKAIETKCKK